MIARGFTKLIVTCSKRTSNSSLNVVRPVYAFCSNNLTPANSISLFRDLVKPKLLKVVEKENKYESENYQRDESIDEFLKKVGFEVKESDNHQHIELKKTVGDTKVIVSFQSRSPNQDQDAQDDQQQSIKQDDQTQDEQPNEDDYQDYSDFTVYLQKGTGKALCYECTSVQSEISINLVSIIDSIEDHKSTPRFERGVKEYLGPEFTTLDEVVRVIIIKKLQSVLQQYLKGFGVNEEVAAFVEHYSLDKEQRLYMTWLKTLESYLKH